jgi:hypothetical protein
VRQSTEAAGFLGDVVPGASGRILNADPPAATRGEKGRSMWLKPGERCFVDPSEPRAGVANQRQAGERAVRNLVTDVGDVVGVVAGDADQSVDAGCSCRRALFRIGLNWTKAPRKPAVFLY